MSQTLELTYAAKSSSTVIFSTTRAEGEKVDKYPVSKEI